MSATNSVLSEPKYLLDNTASEQKVDSIFDLLFSIVESEFI